MKRSSLLLFTIVILIVATGCGRAKLQVLNEEPPVMETEPLNYGENGLELGPVLSRGAAGGSQTLARFTFGGGANASQLKPQIMELVHQAIQDKIPYPYVVFTAMGLGLIRQSQGAGCQYIKVTWKEVQGGPSQTQTYTPPYQQPSCPKSYLAQKKDQLREGKGAAGGYLVVGAKLKDGTYAGVAGAGVLAVYESKLTGCGAGAAGISSTEMAISKSAAGAVCGSVPTTSTIPIP